MSNLGLFGIQSFFILIYLLAVAAAIFWLVKMLRNSNENLRINREILEILRKKND